ncbi:MaoC/PaaZ C-terminal domain-containing protein [Pelagibacterium montanilacus]|uniref:MaoC/PaaZ C-terminal domain-containing protein n=1 Tax=Pelagibacterium montanilacus TaxID=2185280 RepID=UPI000F8D73E7|nr:MaoC/PaaZ C-terminal domain-containing protein [Pelagibacterium montanilacus]
MTRWFEDIPLDEAIDLGAHTFTASEIVAFATRYDPQYFHLDPEAARHSIFGGLVASGWHTISIGHRKMVDRLDAEADAIRQLGDEPGVSGPSPGVSSMRFTAPVYPGDTIRYTLTVTGKRHSHSLPGWGLLFNRIDAHNQSGVQVYTADLVGFSKRRDYVMPLGMRLALALSNLPGMKWLRKKS